MAGQEAREEKGWLVAQDTPHEMAQGNHPLVDCPMYLGGHAKHAHY